MAPQDGLELEKIDDETDKMAIGDKSSLKSEDSIVSISSEQNESITDLLASLDYKSLLKAGKLQLEKYQKTVPKTVEEYLTLVKPLMRRISFAKFDINQNDPNYWQMVRQAMTASIDPIKLDEPNDTWLWMWENRKALDKIRNPRYNDILSFLNVATFEGSYLLHSTFKGRLIEDPSFLFLRVASALHRPNLKDVTRVYNDMSKLLYIQASPTLFNAGLTISQMSSCFLLFINTDSLLGIRWSFDCIAAISKTHGAVGISLSKLRSQTAIGVSGMSEGIGPVEKIINDIIVYVNQGGHRPGAAQITLAFEHLDILNHIVATRKIGDHDKLLSKADTCVAMRDIFFEREKNNESISLFCPSEVDLTGLWGQDFTNAYLQAEKSGKTRKMVKAREMLEEIAISLIEGGRPYCINLDTANRKSNMRNVGIIKSFNLCQEIALPADDKRIPSCNLCSICLSTFVENGKFNWEELTRVAREQVKNLNQVIKRNFYALPEIEFSNFETAPIGIGFQGAYDAICKMDMLYDSPEADEWEAKVCACVYFNALTESVEAAKEFGRYKRFEGSAFSEGILQFDMWQDEAKEFGRPEIKIIQPAEWGQVGSWDELKEDIKLYGTANSQLTTSQPTAGVTLLTGQSEGWEPRYSNVFVRSTNAGDFLEVNRHLQDDLQELGLWHDDTITWLRYTNGSVQGLVNMVETDDQNIIDRLNFIEMKYKTVWEFSQKTILRKTVLRGPYIDASQSTNIYLKDATVGKVMNVLRLSNSLGLKTLIYYLRSREASLAARYAVKSYSGKLTIVKDAKISPVNSTSVTPSIEETLICERKAGCLACQ